MNRLAHKFQKLPFLFKDILNSVASNFLPPSIGRAAFQNFMKFHSSMASTILISSIESETKLCRTVREEENRI